MARIYSDDIDNGVLKRLQMTQLEILDEIVRICEKYDLRYYLYFGTLLGAVRHQGFIPWDDDLDIAMPREDYIKFCSLCQTELGDPYFLHNIDTDSKYWMIWGKVRKKGTVFNENILKDLDIPKGIFVDIFPLDDIPREKSYIKTKIINMLSTVMKYKSGVNGNILKRHLIFGIPFLPFSIRFLSRLQTRLMVSSKCPYYICYGGCYSPLKKTILKEKYEPYKLASFEGRKYRIPNDYDYILTRTYNNYMKLPPEEDRVFKHKPEYIDFGEDQ